MATWAPITKRVIDNGFGKSRNGKAVVGAITHHVAGKDGLKYVANWNIRNSHPTYHIANDGTATGIVHPDRRPTSTGGSIDESAITVEIDNESVGGEWRISDAALATWASIIRHHADESPRRGNPIVVNDPRNTQKGFFVGMHHQYKSTACPGPYVTRNIGTIVAKANGAHTPAPAAPAAPVAPAPSAPVAPSRPPAPANTGRRVLRVGVADGADIGRLQRFLKTNYPAYAGHMTVDNNYGSQTAGVVKEFQRRSRIKPDGVVGLLQTWPALNRAGFSG